MYVAIPSFHFIPSLRLFVAFLSFLNLLVLQATGDEAVNRSLPEKHEIGLCQMPSMYEMDPYYCEGFQMDISPTQVEEVNLICGISTEPETPPKLCSEYFTDLEVCMIKLTFTIRPAREIFINLTQRGCGFSSPKYNILIRGQDFNPKPGRDRRFFNDEFLYAVPLTLDKVGLMETVFTGTELQEFLFDHFLLAREIYITRSYKLFTLISRTITNRFQNLRLLKIADNFNLTSIESEAIYVRPSVELLQIENSDLTGGIKQRAIIIGVRGENKLEVKINNLTINSQKFSESPIYLINNNGNQFRSILIDFRDNNFKGLMRKEMFAKLASLLIYIDDGSILQLKDVRVLFDDVDCCREDNEWLFELPLENRQVFQAECEQGARNVSSIRKLTELKEICSSTPSPTQPPKTTPKTPNTTENIAESRNAQNIIFALGGAVVSIIVFLSICFFCNGPRCCAIKGSRFESHDGSDRPKRRREGKSSEPSKRSRLHRPRGKKKSNTVTKSSDTSVPSKTLSGSKNLETLDSQPSITASNALAPKMVTTGGKRPYVTVSIPLIKMESLKKKEKKRKKRKPVVQSPELDWNVMPRTPRSPLRTKTPNTGSPRAVYLVSKAHPKRKDH